MKILRFVIGTIISIVALAIATKLAAMILAALGFVVGLVFLLLKVALIVGIAMFIIWLVSRLLADRRRSETL
jgi:hypothetical protein